MYKKLMFLIIAVFSVLLVVSCGEETTLTVTTISTTERITSIETENIYLPNLTDKTKIEIKTILNGLAINYEFKYETNDEILEDVFIKYSDSDKIGDVYNYDHTVIIIIATPKLILPDLTGQTQYEMITTLSELNISFSIEIITDNTVADQTFSGYGAGLKIGDLIPGSYTITVYLGYNSTKLPDLEGLIKEQIIELLDETDINYEFTYVIDDLYAEDTFAGYISYETGDFYEGGTVTITLYKNTFTDNDTSLIISKYIDGGDLSLDQAIELYNATNEDIQLGDYFIAIYQNGSFVPNYKISLGDVTLSPGETFVIANSGANANILALTDLTTSDLVFDGNDTIQLCYKNGTYIDTIYNLGNKNFVLDNEVFIRDALVVSGTREFIYNEWHGFIPTYTEGLGTHPQVIPYEVNFNFIDRPFNDPLGGMDSVVLSHAIDGDTASFVPGFISEARVRFLGVDTPETYPEIDFWGPEAKAYTKLILENAENIYIQSDPDLGLYGNYGRSLGLVWVDLGTEGLSIDIFDKDGNLVYTEELSGWILLNYHLVLNGFSYNYYSDQSTLTFENRYLFRLFQEAEIYARENGLGVHQ